MANNFLQVLNAIQETDGASFDNVTHPQVYIGTESLNLENSVFKGFFNGKPVAFKKVEYDSTVSVRNQEDLENFLSLRNENIVTYHHLCVRDSNSRYLVMDLCIGSMLDYLQDIILKDAKLDMSRAMFETAFGLAYLHEQKIIHGCLTLCKVMLWTENDNPNSNPIVKITGYIQLIDNDKMCVQDDIDSLGKIFYAMATKDILNSPRNDLNTRSLKLLKGSQQLDNFIILINSLLNHENAYFKLSTVKELLVNPFLTINVEHARGLLNDNHFVNVEELQKWYDGLGNNKSGSFINQHNFEDLKGIMSSTTRISDVVANAFEYYPDIFSRFIWDRSRTDSPKTKVQNITFIKEKKIGRGANGTVYAGKWINKDGKEIKAACKTLTKEESKGDFDKEVQALKKLDHLFVIKFFGVCEVDLENYIVMELCEGTLEEYVSKGLERIPKNSLDDKIILEQVTLGLAYIHSKRMIHKNLKPSNILLWKQSSESSLVLAKIADFGFAKELKIGQKEFSETDRPGTRSCMAPELLKRVDIGEKFEASFASDAYSLGITIAYTVLKGQHPYGNSKTFQPVFMSSGCDPIYHGELEWDVTDLILKLTKEEPNERPSVCLVIYHPYFSLTNTNPNSVDKLNRTPVHYAAENQSSAGLEILKSLLEKGGNPNAVDEFNQTPVHYAAMNKSSAGPEILKLLLGKGGKPNAVNKWCRTPVHLAAKNETSAGLEILKLLLEKDGNSNAVDKLNRTPVHYTSMNKSSTDSERLKLLLEKDGNPNAVNEWNKTPVHYAAMIQSSAGPEILKLLLEKDGNPNAVDEFNRTPVHYAAMNKSSTGPEILKILLGKDGNPNAVNQWNQTPVHYAAMNQSFAGPKIIRILLEKDGNPNATNDWNKTPVHYAAENKSIAGPEILKLLLEKDGNPNAVNKWCRTPVHYAAENKSTSAGPEILKLLLKKKGNPNAVDKNNYTPLHCAAMNQSSAGPKVLKLLLEKGGKPNADNKWCQTPIYLAAKNESRAGPKMLKLLLEKDRNSNADEFI